MNLELAGVGLNAIRRITDLWSAGKADSLIDYTSVARVEPLTIIDAACLYLDSIGQVQQSLLSVFAGYYLQAVALSATVGKVEVVRQLDRMNPNRNPLDSALNTAGTGSYAGGLIRATEEYYEHRLPVPGDEARWALEQMAMEAQTTEQLAAARDRREARKQRNDDTRTRNDSLKVQGQNAKFDFDVANVYAQREMADKEFKHKVEETKRKYEADEKKFGADEAYRRLQVELQREGLALNQAKRDDEHSRSEFGIGRDTMSTIREASDLSVGKLLSVEITDGLHKAAIPVSVRLIASSIPSASLVHILSQGTEDTSMKERWHAWRSGRISFIKDLCFAQDLIDAHKKNLMADKDGMFSTILRRNRNNQLATIVSGNPSVATASNLCVMSHETAAQLELKINGKLRDFHTREKMFKKTYMMIMAVIDTQWERVTFYHRGIQGATEVGIRDLKAANKGSGPDVSDILRAYNLGQSPTL